LKLRGNAAVVADHISPLLIDNGISRSLLIVNRTPLVDGTALGGHEQFGA
jgi:hypothetical protein